MKHNRAFCVAYRDVNQRREPGAPAFPISLIKTAQKSILALLFCCSSNVFAANTWSYHQENDRLSNRSYSFALSPIPAHGLYDDIKLQVLCKDNSLQVSVDADSLIASQGSAFDFEYQIDKNPPVTLQMKTFPDSKRKGYTEEYAKRIVDDLLTGQSIFIRIKTMIQKVLSAAMPLENAAEPVKHVLADCGLNPSGTTAAESGYSLSEFELDFGKLPPERQQQVLGNIKKIITDAQQAPLIKK